MCSEQQLAEVRNNSLGYISALPRHPSALPDGSTSGGSRRGAVRGVDWEWGAGLRDLEFIRQS